MFGLWLYFIFMIFSVLLVFIGFFVWLAEIIFRSDTKKPGKITGGKLMLYGFLGFVIGFGSCVALGMLSSVISIALR